MTLEVVSVGPAAADVLAALHGAVADAGLPVWSAGTFASLLAVPGTAALVARTGERPLGLVLWRAAGDEAEILRLAVVPEARRRGVASALVAAVAAAARERTRLVLEVAEDNAPARALYAAQGFTEAARRRRYYRRADGARIDALVLARPLDAAG